MKPFPKVELHCHLEGILDRAMLADIRKENPAFPVDPAAFEQAYPVVDFESFLNWWKFIQPAWALTSFYPVLGRYIARLKAQGVRYAEIMIAASLFPGDAAAAVDVMAALREWVNRLEDSLIQVEFLATLGRGHSPEALAELAERALVLHKAGLIVGVALAGAPEKDCPVKPFQRTFDRLHAAGLSIEIHAGEWCGTESVRDALEYGHPDRIGHGVSLFQDACLVELFKARQIHIEMCPTSNVKTGSVSRIQEHPVRLARDFGLSFSINTDDPGPFECSLESEYALLEDTFGFDEGDFQKIYANSLAARFQPTLRLQA